MHISIGYNIGHHILPDTGEVPGDADPTRLTPTPRRRCFATCHLPGTPKPPAERFVAPLLNHPGINFLFMISYVDKRCFLYDIIN